MAANKKIKVSEATVAKLRKGTMAGNLAKAKNASPEMREALIRFYGAKRVNAAGGNKVGSGSATVRENLTKSPVTPNQREGRTSVPTVKPSGGPGAKKVTMTPPKGGPGSKGRTPAPMPKGGPGAKSPSSSTAKPKTTTAKGTGNTKRVNKPLFDITKIGGNSQAKLTSKAKSNADLYAKQQKAAQAKKKGMK
jgi:hypothetical protein